MNDARARGRRAAAAGRRAGRACRWPSWRSAWVLRRPELASAIVGASRPEQVHANAKASGIELTPDTLAAIDEALGDAPVKEPTLAPFARRGGDPPLSNGKGPAVRGLSPISVRRRDRDATRAPSAREREQQGERQQPRRPERHRDPVDPGLGVGLHERDRLRGARRATHGADARRVDPRRRPLRRAGTVRDGLVVTLRVGRTRAGGARAEGRDRDRDRHALRQLRGPEHVAPPWARAAGGGCEETLRPRRAEPVTRA